MALQYQTNRITVAVAWRGTGFGFRYPGHNHSPIPITITKKPDLKDPVLRAQLAKGKGWDIMMTENLHGPYNRK